MLKLYVRAGSWLRERWAARRAEASSHRVVTRIRNVLRHEAGQTTAEYALVILAAAAVAIVLIAWARSSGKLPAFFDRIIDNITNSAQ